MFTLPVTIYEGVSEMLYFENGLFRFFWYAIIGFPLISIYFAVHHSILYLAQKKKWLSPSFYQRVLIGSGLSTLYVLFWIISAPLKWEVLLSIPFFAYLAIIYEIAARIMEKLNWWTLFNQRE
jgi:hypothetical protein